MEMIWPAGWEGVAPKIQKKKVCIVFKICKFGYVTKINYVYFVELLLLGDLTNACWEPQVF